MDKSCDLEKTMNEVYLKFKLNFYRNLFRNGEFGKEKLTVMENFCAEAIYALKGPNINELAEFIQVSQPNAAYKVNNLVKKGYIKKIPSTIDKRQVHLYVTDKFKEHYSVNYNYIHGIIRRLEGSIDQEHLETFCDVLEIMENGLMTEVSKDMDSMYLDSKKEK